MVGEGEKEKMMDGKNNEWIGKKVYLILKTGRKYSGRVVTFDNNFIFIIDKFGEKVLASISDVSSLEEEK